MRFIVLLFCSLWLCSCVGTYGFHGHSVDTYSIAGNQSVRLTTSSLGVYTFELSNNSKEKNTLIVQVPDVNDIHLEQGETVKIENKPLNGIKIVNKTDGSGDLRLSIYLHNQNLKMPEVEVVK